MNTDNNKRETHDFAKGYEQSALPEMRKLECQVLGCEYGGTSWTTVSEVKQIAELLNLSANDRLLEVGAGSGWPGLLLASMTGCEVYLTDIPFVGLRQARERSRAEGISQKTQTIVASATALPFKDRFFDGISHSDVLCCLPEKIKVLHECRRLAHAKTVMVFSVIAPAPSLSSPQRELAVASGPPFVDVSDDYAILLQRSGWKLRKRINVTEEYARSTSTFVNELRTEFDALSTALGVDEYQALLQRRENAVNAIESGLLQREIFVVGA